jgi:hypothetical protein
LSDDRRDRVWRASGVRGVTPPGTQKPGEGAVAEWLKNKEKKGGRKPNRPKPGAPDPKKEAAPPPDFRTVLDRIAAFVGEHPLPDVALGELSREIAQSHAPFEIIVAFTLLSAGVGPDEDKRRKFHYSLERGAKAYYNLARRLDKSVRAPRGLVPQTLDPLFYDLPDTAFQIPGAFVVEAFSRALDPLRADPNQDRKLIALVDELRSETIAGRSFGDQKLETMFPWEPPEWAPSD